MLMWAKPLFSQKAELLLYTGCLVNAFKVDTLSHIKTHDSMSCGPRSWRRAHRGYIDSKKENVIFTLLYLSDPLSHWNQICYRVARQPGESTY